MPVASATATADFFAAQDNGSGSTGSQFGRVWAQYGAPFDEKSGSHTAPRQYSPYFEIEVPEGATVIGARVTFESYSPSFGTTVSYRMGLLERDGLWDVSGWNATNYPTYSSIPWVVQRLLSPNRYSDMGNLHNDMFVQGVHTLVTSGSWTQGEGMVVDRDLTGLVAILQDFLDATTETHRGYSASGTAIPMILTWGASTVQPGVAAVQSEEGIGSTAATLEIEYTEAASPGLFQVTELQGTLRGPIGLSGRALTRETLTATQPNTAQTLRGTKAANTSLTGTVPGNETLTGKVE